MRWARTKKTKFDARTWYHEQRYGVILDHALQRIYFQRCQLGHGAASFGSRLNRTAAVMLHSRDLILGLTCFVTNQVRYQSATATTSSARAVRLMLRAMHGHPVRSRLL